MLFQDKCVTFLDKMTTCNCTRLHVKTNLIPCWVLLKLLGYLSSKLSLLIPLPSIALIVRPSWRGMNLGKFHTSEIWTSVPLRWCLNSSTCKYLLKTGKWWPKLPQSPAIWVHTQDKDLASLALATTSAKQLSSQHQKWSTRTLKRLWTQISSKFGLCCKTYFLKKKLLSPQLWRQSCTPTWRHQATSLWEVSKETRASSSPVTQLAPTTHIGSVMMSGLLLKLTETLGETSEIIATTPLWRIWKNSAKKVWHKMALRWSKRYFGSQAHCSSILFSLLLRLLSLPKGLTSTIHQVKLRKASRACSVT